ncbi:hypothetical protein BDV10DRAFT_173901 [Aspergillus recurvatus]
MPRHVSRSWRLRLLSGLLKASKSGQPVRWLHCSWSPYPPSFPSFHRAFVQPVASSSSLASATSAPVTIEISPPHHKPLLPLQVGIRLNAS